MAIRGDRRTLFGWALYDWANSAFATTVMAGFFPVFFKEYWARDLTATDSTFWLGAINSVAGILMILGAPVLGALADQTGRVKRYLGVFTAMGVIATAMLSGIHAGAWIAALLAFLFGVMGFLGGNVYYDSLLPRIVPTQAFDHASALGFAMGYIGGGLLFAINVAMVSWPGFFGFAGTADAVRFSFLSVALWWGFFSIPLFIWVPAIAGRATGGRTVTGVVADAFRQIGQTLRHLRQYPNTMGFLIAYWFYIDGVDTIIRMAADYGLSIGLEAPDLMTALLVTQFVGFPSALAFGVLGSRVGPKKGILIGLFVYLFIILWAYQMQSSAEFYVLAVAVGMVQGGVQALSRSLFARLVPQERSGEFFGFYNMMGKFAVVLGPLIVGVVALATGDSRASILSVAALFVIGGVILYFLKLPDGRVH